MKALVVFMVLVVLVVVGQTVESSESEDIRFKVCTASELRQQVTQVCMRIGQRDGGNSRPAVGSLGSIVLDEPTSSQLSDGALAEILKLARPYARRTARERRARVDVHKISWPKRLYKRSMSDDMSGEQLCEYVSSCCNHSCVISSQDLIPYCTQA